MIFLRKVKGSMILVIITGILLLTFIMQGYFQKQLDSYLKPGDVKGPAIAMKEVIMAGRDKGEKVWEIMAPSVVVGADKKEATYRGNITGILYSSGKPFLQIKASFIKMQMGNRSFNIQDEIEILQIGKEGRFFTKDMFWDASTGEFTCPNPISVVSQKAIFKARRLKGNTRTGRFMLENVFWEGELPQKEDL